MRDNLLSVLIVSLFLGTFTPSVAQEEVSRSRERRGAVVGAHFIYALENFDFGSSEFSADDGLGFEILGGYRFNRYVDLTGVFQYVSAFDIDGTVLRVDGDPVIRSTVATAWGFTLMPTTRVYPFADLLPEWIEPFGLFGLGLLFAQVDDPPTENDATIGFRFGAGVDFYLMPELVLEVGGGYVLAGTDLHFFGSSVSPNYAPLVAGVEYRF